MREKVYKMLSSIEQSVHKGKCQLCGNLKVIFFALHLYYSVCVKKYDELEKRWIFDLDFSIYKWNYSLRSAFLPSLTAAPRKPLLIVGGTLQSSRGSSLGMLLQERVAKKLSSFFVASGIAFHTHSAILGFEPVISQITSFILWQLEILEKKPHFFLFNF